MSESPIDPRWPKLLSLSVHEFRTPLTVVSGYIRMLLKDRAGPLNEQQRKLLVEAEKSCARLSGLLAETSELANLESGGSALNRQRVDLREILRSVIDQLPSLQDRNISIVLEMDSGPAPVQADPSRLSTALVSVISAVRRELVAAHELVVHEQRLNDDAPRHRIAIGDRATIETVRRSAPSLPLFDEWRGGCGMSLPVARRLINAHGGSLWSPPDGGKAGALIVLPAAACREFREPI